MPPAVLLSPAALGCRGEPVVAVGCVHRGVAHGAAWHSTAQCGTAGGRWLSAWCLLSLPVRAAALGAAAEQQHQLGVRQLRALRTGASTGDFLPNQTVCFYADEWMESRITHMSG